jgi:DNA repair exonuclease SbcCD ATPase subunit
MSEVIERGTTNNTEQGLMEAIYTQTGIEDLIQKIQNNVRNNNTTIESYNTKIQTLSKQLDSSRTLFNITNDKLKTLLDEREQLRKDCGLLDDSISGINSKVVELLNYVMENQPSASTPVLNLSNVADAYVSWMNKTQELENDLQTQTLKTKNVIDELNSLPGSLDSVEYRKSLEEKTKSETRQIKIANDLNETRQKIETLEKGVESLIREIDRVEQNHKTQLASIIEDHQQNLNKETEKFGALQNQFDSISSDLENKESIINQLTLESSKIAGLESRIEELRNNRDSQSKTLNEKSTTIENNLKILDSLKTKIIELEKTIFEDENKINELEIKKSKLLETKQNYEQLLATLKTEIEKLNITQSSNYGGFSIVTNDMTAMYLDDEPLDFDKVKGYRSLNPKEQESIRNFFTIQYNMAEPKEQTPTFDQYQHTMLYIRKKMKTDRVDENFLKQLFETGESLPIGFVEMIRNFVPIIHP